MIYLLDKINFKLKKAFLKNMDVKIIFVGRKEFNIILNQLNYSIKNTGICSFMGYDLMRVDKDSFVGVGW